MDCDVIIGIPTQIRDFAPNIGESCQLALLTCAPKVDLTRAVVTGLRSFPATLRYSAPGPRHSLRAPTHVPQHLCLGIFEQAYYGRQRWRERGPCLSQLARQSNQEMALASGKYVEPDKAAADAEGSSSGKHRLWAGYPARRLIRVPERCPERLLEEWVPVSRYRTGLLQRKTSHQAMVGLVMAGEPEVYMVFGWGPVVYLVCSSAHFLPA